MQASAAQDRTTLPFGPPLVDELSFLMPSERRLLARIGARTRATLLGFFERCIGAAEEAAAALSSREIAARDVADLAATVDGILRAQAGIDADHFLEQLPLPLPAADADRVRAALLKAYRWLDLVAGATDPRFRSLLEGPTTAAQRRRVEAAVARLTYAMPSSPVAPRLAA